MGLNVVRIWDWPTRVFHWALVICVVGAVVTVNLGGLWIDWHARLGYTILTLLIFRVLWGFMGPEHARFASFVKGPSAIWRYLRHGSPTAGHSPLAALSVLAFLLALGFQAVTGLFVNDAIFFDGPLVRLISRDLSDDITQLHKLNRFVILGLIGLHLLALVVYRFKGQRLVGAMITGDKMRDAVPAGTRAVADTPMLWMRASVLLALSAGLVWWMIA